MLAAYEHALSLTRDMLTFARNGDWDNLVKFESDRSRVIDDLRTHDPSPARDGTASRKRDIVAQILKMDEEIQLLSQDWMHELRDILNSVSTEQRLSRTYGS
ncbi:MAG: flagellar protein FliT [Burkholderiales bacterium]|nr:flagellar protein FliT [Burkholderiales bacterium]